MSKPIAVLISDVHFSIHTLELASAALLKAQYKAKVLDVPLVIAGDLLDSKAIIRAECANKLIQMLSVKDKTETIVLVGNHDLCNEKGKEHSLNFLKPYCIVVENSQFGRIKNVEIGLIPYQSNVESVRAVLKDEDCPKLLIMHQGIVGSTAGHYIQDKSAITKEDVQDFRVISGHYHTRQDIKCGRPRPGAVGLYSYIGNPYTLGFKEAGDPEKGFQILMDDGTLEFVPTNLRKHIVVNVTADTDDGMSFTNKDNCNLGDLVWVKITGPSEYLKRNGVNSKKLWANMLNIKGDFKLDLIPLEQETSEVKSVNVTQDQVFDSLIDSLSNTEDTRKNRLKSIWKGFSNG